MPLPTGQESWEMGSAKLSPFAKPSVTVMVIVVIGVVVIMVIPICLGIGRHRHRDGKRRQPG